MLDAIAKHELLERLASAEAGALCVVTPNARLARELAREFDARQAAGGRPVWNAADIIPLTAWIERLYQDLVYAGDHANPGPLPGLLTPTQERTLWIDAIRAGRWGDALLAVPEAAADAARAFELAHSWRLEAALGSVPASDDAKAFADWSRGFVAGCQRLGAIDRARLSDVVAARLDDAALVKPRVLVAYAFGVVKPQQRELFEACARAGVEVIACSPADRSSRASRRVFPAAREELAAAAAWARARLDGGAARVGVVVPELGLRRREVMRVFARVLDPGGNLPGRARRQPAFNLSLGAPLADYPIVHAALTAIELCVRDLPYERVSKLVRSPFLGDADAEMEARALLDARLRRRAPARLGLVRLIGLAQGIDGLRRRLEAMFEVPQPARDGPQHWARHFSERLAAAGFPGRALDSDEYQARVKFEEALAELASLGRVVPRMREAEAVSMLRRLCAETPFQPESADAPIHVLGVLESEGLEFDALWVSGLTDDAWPLRANPNPFIPIALQKRAGIPEATPESSLQWARRITAGWLTAAPEVVLSHPAREEDRELVGSSLVAGVPQDAGASDVASYPRYRDLLFSQRRVEDAEDGLAPPLPTRTPRGGTRVLADQSACPFRAFARHRLGAEPLEEPAEGPDARQRGSLLHALMKSLWTRLGGSERLQGDCSAEIARAADEAIAEVGIEEPFAALERTRLAKLAREWLAVERTRAPFEVVALEEPGMLQAGGLELSGRIDRIDRLASGGVAVIDYKTGRATPNEWLGIRPDDPQLPLYTLNAEGAVAVAFAKLKPGEMRYMGFSRLKDAIPRVQQAKNWDALVSDWKAGVDALARAFAAGEAGVDPKRGLQTCRRCDLQPLCRVHERLGALDAGDDEEDDGNAEGGNA